MVKPRVYILSKNHSMNAMSDHLRFTAAEATPKNAVAQPNMTCPL